MEYEDELTQKIIEEALNFVDEDEVAELLEEYPDEWFRLDACRTMKALSGVLGVNIGDVGALREWGFSDEEINVEFDLDTYTYDKEVAYDEYVDRLIHERKEDKLLA